MGEPIELTIADDDPELLEKIVDHFTARMRSGEHPSITEYQDRFPAHRDEIDDLLSSVAMIEQLKPNSASNTDGRPLLDKVASLKQIGNYKIVREVGRGGMGVVFEAIHESLGRQVALKVMPTPLVNSQKYIERFQREAKAAAKLHHTNIVSVFGVGEGEGYHFYVMDFIDGQTLSQIVDGLANSGSAFKDSTTARQDNTRLNASTRDALRKPNESESSGSGCATNSLNSNGFKTNGSSASSDSADLSNDYLVPIPKQKQNPEHFRWAAKIGASLADAIVYAHQNKILHRDIKPSNVVLDHKGVPWITDFGLAKDDANEINLTKTGDVIGTPRYLAPESLEGKYDQRSEVYCIGLTLYEMATLQPAYAKGTTAEVIRAIATTKPTPPRKINSKIPIDLSTIIEKAIESEPANRYQTASQLHSDLVAFLDDRPIDARPPSMFENTARWGRRNPLAAVLSAVSALLLGLVAVSASIGYLYTNHAYKEEAKRSAELSRQTNLAQSETEKAKEQFTRAEANVAIAIEAFDEMFSQVVSRGSSRGLNIEGFDELMGVETNVTRKDAAFLKKLLDFYDRFATENADNESLRKESARAFRRAGNIYQLVGDYALANDAYKKSVDLYQQLYDESSSWQELSDKDEAENDYELELKELLISLVQTKSEYSRSLGRVNQSNSGDSPNRRGTAWTDSGKQNKEAIAILKDLPTEQLDDRLTFELAKTLNTLGSSNSLRSILSSGNSRRPPGPSRFNFFPRQFNGQPNGKGQGRPDDARGSRGNELRKGKLGGGKQGGGGGKQNGGKQGGNRYRGDGTRPEGLRGSDPRRGGGRSVGRMVNSLSSQSLDLLDELVKANPDNIDYRSARANTYCSLAWSLLHPSPDRAREMRQLAISELESLIEIEPENPSYRFRLAMVCLVRDVSKSDDEEDKLLNRALKLTEELTTQLPDVPDYHALNGSAWCQKAEVMVNNLELKPALDVLLEAKKSFDQVAELLPANSPKHRLYRVLYFSLDDLAKASREQREMSILKQASALRGELPVKSNQDRPRR